jgi:hypothetical protein
MAKKGPMVKHQHHQLHLLGDFGRKMMRNMDADVVAEKFDPAHIRRKKQLAKHHLIASIQASTRFWCNRYNSGLYSLKLGPTSSQLEKTHRWLL